MIKLQNVWLAAAVAATLGLSACGGDGGGGGGGNGQAGGDTAVPASAGASVASFMSFLQGLDTNDETSEPLTLSDGFAVPDDEMDDGSVLS